MDRRITPLPLSPAEPLNEFGLFLEGTGKFCKKRSWLRPHIMKTSLLPVFLTFCGISAAPCQSEKETAPPPPAKTEDVKPPKPVRLELVRFRGKTGKPSSDHSVWKLAVSLLSAMLGLVSGQHASAQAPPVDLPELKLSTYGIVRTMALQADGKILVGGEFTSVNDIPRKNLARLNPDGTLDLSWAPALDGPCHKLMTDDQHVYIAGDFSMISGEAYEDFGRVTVATGAVDTSVVRNLFADSDSSLTMALEQIGGSIFIGSSNGQTKKMEKSSARLDSTWTPEPGSKGVEVLLGVGDFLYV